MELFFFGAAFGMIFGFILVGIFGYVRTDEREHSQHNSSDSDVDGDFGDNNGLDRHNNPSPEEVVNGLNAMSKILGVCNTERVYLTYAANYISEKEGLD